MSDKNILLISGCARSGTTAFTRLLNAHPHINITVEKYQSEFRADDKSFTKVKFENDIVEKKKPANIVFIGDKVPGYYKDYNKIFTAFPDARVLFLFRNIFDVSQSYKRRQEHETNQWSKGVRMAVKDWNESLENTLKCIEANGKVLPLVYENVFFKQSKQLIGGLKLKKNKTFDTFYKRSIKIARNKEKKREYNLKQKEKLWILNNANFDAYRKLFKIYKDGDYWGNFS